MLDHHNIPKVDLSFLNRDHQEALDISNHLEILLSEGSPLDHAEKIEREFVKLLDHHIVHFEHEDREMEKYGFPAYEVHVAEHRHVLEDMGKELGYWRSHRDVARLKDYLLTEFPHWLMNHLVNMDTVSATYISRVRHNDLDQAKGF